MGGLPFYTYMIGVCVSGICDWHDTSENNTFTSLSNCMVAAEISTHLLNNQYMDIQNFSYRTIEYQCFNWYEAKMENFKDKYGFTEAMGY